MIFHSHCHEVFEQVKAHSEVKLDLMSIIVFLITEASRTSIPKSYFSADLNFLQVEYLKVALLS